MGHAYTPGLLVTPFKSHIVTRILPVPGEVLVSKGDMVNASDVVAQTHLPGEVYPLNLANMMAVPPGDVPSMMKIKEGDSVNKGDVMAQTPGIFGMMKKSIHSKYTGTLETVSGVTGQAIVRGPDLPVRVQAYISGIVKEIIPNQGCLIESNASYIQGIFGIGGETCGKLTVVAERNDQCLTPDQINTNHRGKVIVGGARLTHNAILRALELGVSGIVSGGIDDADLKKFLGYDLGVAITGSENVGLTLVITEGFGDIAMAEATFKLCKTLEGKEASINGSTQIRAGVMRPEIVVPLTTDEVIQKTNNKYDEGQLAIGRTVRIIRDPYFGCLAEVAGLPSEPAILGSGSKARVLEVQLDGELVTVPRANVELIEA